MAAGLGFKTFNTGDVLSAADTNGYLMQGVLVFADATARNAAITSPQEGQFAYLKDTNVTTYYTGSAWANLDTTGMTNPMTTTGDTIYSSSGSTPARLGIGSTGQVLTVAAGVPSWATPAGGSSFAGVSAYKSTGQSINNSSFTAITFDSENFDSNTYHNNSTNNTRLTVPAGKAGYYSVNGSLTFAGNATGLRIVLLRKNGGETNYPISMPSVVANDVRLPFVYTIYLDVADYVEVHGWQNSGGALNVQGGITDTTFSMYLIGA